MAAANIRLQAPDKSPVIVVSLDEFADDFAEDSKTALKVARKAKGLPEDIGADKQSLLRALHEYPIIVVSEKIDGIVGGPSAVDVIKGISVDNILGVSAAFVIKYYLELTPANIAGLAEYTKRMFVLSEGLGVDSADLGQRRHIGLIAFIHGVHCYGVAVGASGVPNMSASLPVRYRWVVGALLEGDGPIERVKLQQLWRDILVNFVKNPAKEQAGFEDLTALVGSLQKPLELLEKFISKRAAAANVAEVQTPAAKPEGGPKGAEVQIPAAKPEGGPKGADVQTVTSETTEAGVDALFADLFGNLKIYDMLHSPK